MIKADNMILVLGSKGMLGWQLMKLFGNNAIGWDRDDVDVLNNEKLKSKIQNLQPEAIINCAAYNDVDGAEIYQRTAFQLNAETPKILSDLCNSLDIPLVHFSTNYVFDGEKGAYSESDTPNPQSVYAKSKFQGELNVIGRCKKYYLVRTSVIFGPKGQSKASKKSFVELMLKTAKEQSQIRAVEDQKYSLSYSVDLAKAVKTLFDDKKAFGVYHIINSGEASWFDFAKEIFLILKKNVNVLPVSSKEFARKAVLPAKSVLINNKLKKLRPWREALREYLINL